MIKFADLDFLGAITRDQLDGLDTGSMAAKYLQITLDNTIPVDMYTRAIGEFQASSNFQFFEELVNASEYKDKILFALSSQEIADFYKQLGIQPPVLNIAAGVIGYQDKVVVCVNNHVMSRTSALERDALCVHEFVHVEQIASGRLVQDHHKGIVFWLGEPYMPVTDFEKITFEDYVRLPWEKEAYSKQISWMEEKQ